MENRKEKNNLKKHYLNLESMRTSHRALETSRK